MDIAQEGTQRASTTESSARTEEQTSTDSTSDLYESNGQPPVVQVVLGCWLLTYSNPKREVGELSKVPKDG